MPKLLGKAMPLEMAIKRYTVVIPACSTFICSWLMPS